MALEYGEGGSFTVTMDGPFGNAGSSVVKLTSFSAFVANWKGGTSPYFQTVDVPGISVNSKVDIQMNAEQMQQMRDMDIAFTTENDAGVVTLWAIGDKPETDLVFQATLTEVVA